MKRVSERFWDLLKKKRFSLFCKSCSIQSVEEIEEDMNKRLFPRICIGHVAVALTVIYLVWMELF